jgi:hypothetical protein
MSWEALRHIDAEWLAAHGTLQKLLPPIMAALAVFVRLYQQWVGFTVASYPPPPNLPPPSPNLAPQPQPPAPPAPPV